MPVQLTKPQRAFALHYLMFDRPLSAELHEALRYATTAGQDNGIPETGIIEFFCGLYLHYGKQLAEFLNGDIVALLRKIFPKHRFGDAGLISADLFDNAAADEESCESGIMYPVSYSDDLIQLLWTATRLANAVGKKTSLKDVISAVTLHDNCIVQLENHGIHLNESIADFRDALSVIFFATVHAHESWPRTLSFDVEQEWQSPFTVVVKTPSGGFQPMRRATVTLNGVSIARLSWPDTPVTSVIAALQSKNTIELEVDGPRFGSMEITIRETRATI